MSLEIKVQETNVATVVAVAGSLTLGQAANRLREALQTLVAEGKRKIVLNLADVSYLDSTGIGVLVSSSATITRTGGRLKLSNLSNPVKDTLLLTKLLLTVFEIYQNDRDALNSFAESASASKSN
jgi:anti-sigma B factor antagonist